MTRAAFVALFVLVVARTAAADCAADATALRAHLTEQAPRVRTWNLAWGIAFGAAAAGQVALAATQEKPLGTFDKDYQETLYVGAAKATLGAGARLVMPLRIRIPAIDPDPCTDLAHLRASLAKIGRQERQTFWLTHLGGIAVNLTGAFILWHRRSFAVGAVSFLISSPVGPISAYTMPRGSWHRWREERASWGVAVLPHDGGWLLGAAGEF